MADNVTFYGYLSSIHLGNGAGDTVTFDGDPSPYQSSGTSDQATVALGDGNNDLVTIKEGQYNTITLGNGNDDSVTDTNVDFGGYNTIKLGDGNNDTVNASNNDTITLGKGDGDTVNVGNGGSNNTIRSAMVMATW